MSDIERMTEHLIGMELDKARDLYGTNGWIIRCVSADGKPRLGTGNVMPNRINVETVGGKITKVRSVG